MGPQYPQYPQYVPNPPQPPRAPWWGVVLAIALLLAILFCTYVGVYALTRSSFSPQTSPFATATTAPSVLLVSPSPSMPPPTATPKGPRLITGAVYGGPQSAFTAAYGDPTTQYGQSLYSATIADGTAITICFCDSITSSDGQPHVDILSVYPTDSSQWSDQLVATLRQMFLPLDAKYLHDVQTPDVGVEHVYQSADLAKTFPHDDSNGIFSVDCSSQQGTQCSLVTGQ